MLVYSRGTGMGDQKVIGAGGGVWQDSSGTKIVIRN
jgi:hypothetical protein